MSEKSGVAAIKPGYPLTVAAADFDNDGWQDLYVACDTTPSLLLHNNHNGTFTEQGLESGISLSEDGQAQGRYMGLGIGDFDTDGNLDILKTHFRDDTPALYRGTGKGDFRDVTFRAGLGVETRYVSWGAGMVDLDNDGLPDLFYATGMVYPEVEKSQPDCPYKTPCVLYRNLGGGKFEELVDEAGPAIQEAHSSRGVAFGDFDNDGDIDILIMNMNEPPSLLRNGRQDGRQSLPAEGPAHRDNVESQRHRRPRGGAVRRAQADAGGAGAVILPVGERSPPPFRDGSGDQGQPGDSLAHRRRRKDRRSRRRSVGGGAGGLGRGED